MNSTQVNPVVATFLSLLAQANAVVVDSPVLSTWASIEPIGDAANEVVRFAWEDQDASFEIILTEGGIAAGKWEGDSFFCEDHEGDEVQISLYRHLPVSPNSKTGFQEAMDDEFQRWIIEQGLPTDLSAMELLSGGTRLSLAQREWINAWTSLYPGPL